MKCYKCGTQDVARFAPSAIKQGQPTGKRGGGNSSQMCRECRAQYRIDYYQQNRDRILARAKRDNQKPDVKARANASSKRFYQRNREQILLDLTIKNLAGKTRKVNNYVPTDNNIPALAYRGPQPRKRDWRERYRDFDRGAWNWTPGGQL